MLQQAVSSGLVQPSSSTTLGHTQTHPSLPDTLSASVHPLLLAFYLAVTCFCLMMAYYLDSNRRSSKARQSSPQPEKFKDKHDPESIIAGPGEWIRPLGNLETFMETGGEYGSLNTVQAIWLSSEQPIISDDVRQALAIVAEKTHMLQVCVEWRGMRPWFKRMDEVIVDFEVDEDDAMAVFYTRLQKAYNMAKGPLWGARLAPIPRQSPDDPHRAVLVFCAHHCITDGHTNMTFCRDVMEVLNASMTGKVYEVPLRPVISAISDSLISKRDWYYVFRYFWTKLYNAIITDYSTKLYFKGALVQPQTKIALTKILRDKLTVEQTKELIRHCKAAGVTVHSCIMATANLALLQTVKQRAKYRVDAARINTVNCINMRRYFPAELKESAGCHISLEEKELMIPCSAANSKEHFWSLVKVFQKNLNDSLNVLYTPIKNTPLFRPSTIVLHANYELTRRGRKNRTDNHMISTNMGNLKHLLPGKYDGPVEITDILRSVSSELTGNPFTLVFHTFMDRFMISIDYYTNKMTDEAASQFFANLVAYIGNITRYGTVREPVPALNSYLATANGTANGNAVKVPTANGVKHTTDAIKNANLNGGVINGGYTTMSSSAINGGHVIDHDTKHCNGLQETFRNTIISQ